MKKTAPKVLALAGAAAALTLALAWTGLHTAHAAAPPANALPPVPGAESIHDDPTVAPDPKQSADKNLSLPADI